MDTRRQSHRRLLLGVLTLAALVDCTYYNTFYPPEPEPDAGVVDAGVDAGVVDAGTDAGFVDAGTPPGCDPSALFIYTFTEDNSLYRFDPPSQTFTFVGRLNCPSQSFPYSMAVARDGTAFVEYGDGTIFNVDITNAHCKPTPFVPNQSGFFNFGMGFSANSPGSSDETLFVSDAAGKGLASVDTTTFELTPIGAYPNLIGNGITGRAELTGTGDGRLYGGFEGMPFILALINKTDATILSEVPQDIIDATSQGSNFAFAAWGGEFWFFVGPGGSTNLFRYNPMTATTTLMKTVSLEVVGAGVSTCAPMR